MLVGVVVGPYSRIRPHPPCCLQIVVSLVNGRPGSMNFSYSPLLRDFTKATNIRLRFLRTNTLLGHLMGKALRDPTVTRRVRAERGCPSWFLVGALGSG